MYFAIPTTRYDYYKLIHASINNVGNFKNALFHEYVHVQNGDGIRPENIYSTFNHTNVFLSQIKHSSFSETTSSFRLGIVDLAAKYLQQAANQQSTPYQFKEINDQANKFNNLSSKTGARMVPENNFGEIIIKTKEINK